MSGIGDLERAAAADPAEADHEVFHRRVLRTARPAVAAAADDVIHRDRHAVVARVVLPARRGVRLPHARAGLDLEVAAAHEARAIRGFVLTAETAAVADASERDAAHAPSAGCAPVCVS